jgi:predicted nuclease of restriction endonuclease-like (RecB) superfamily
MKRSDPHPLPAYDIPAKEYHAILGDIVGLLESARSAAARSTNTLMTATYWFIGRRIVEYEQKGKARAAYGERLMERLAEDLTERYHRGFKKSNLFQMRAFYLAYPNIFQTLSGKSAKAKKFQMASGTLPAHPAHVPLDELAKVFPLPWSHYVLLLSLKDAEARDFYRQQALKGGWTVRQLDRQISSQFYQRTLLSRSKAALIKKEATPHPDDLVTAEEEIKDPFVLEFLGLKDEYSESDLEEALIRKLEETLMEFGNEFAFVARQRRLRIGDEWYRIDLLFYNRKLRCLVVVDLKLGKFTHADAGQMHTYLNYAREHWVLDGENPPVGLILCSRKDETVAKYSLEGLPNKILAAEYKMALPDEKKLVAELEKTRKMLEARLLEKKQG